MKIVDQRNNEMSADKTNTTFTKIFADRDNLNNKVEEMSFIVAVSWPYRGYCFSPNFPRS